MALIRRLTAKDTTAVFGRWIWLHFRIQKNITFGLNSTFREIQRHFGIDWQSVQWEDLRKPLYSALAARLILSNVTLTESIPLASDVAAQASYWRRHYNAVGTEPRFIADVMALEEGTVTWCCCSGLNIQFSLHEHFSLAIISTAVRGRVLLLQHNTCVDWITHARAGTRFISYVLCQVYSHVSLNNPTKLLNCMGEGINSLFSSLKLKITCLHHCKNRRLI